MVRRDRRRVEIVQAELRRARRTSANVGRRERETASLVGGFDTVCKEASDVLRDADPRSGARSRAYRSAEVGGNDVDAIAVLLGEDGDAQPAVPGVFVGKLIGSAAFRGEGDERRTRLAAVVALRLERFRRDRRVIEGRPQRRRRAEPDDGGEVRVERGDVVRRVAAGRAVYARVTQRTLDAEL